jgi:hypothetical protein
VRARRFAIAMIAVSCGYVLVAAAPAGAHASAKASTKTKVPDSCTLITKADVTTAFAKLDAALQPLSVADPEIGKPSNQGGQGTNSCSTSFMLPNSVGGSVLVKTFPVTKQTPCFPKGQPGKSIKIAGTKVLVEPNPSDGKVTRDVTFVDQGGCAFIEIFLSGGSAKIPQSAFTDLAAAALAKPSA